MAEVVANLMVEHLESRIEDVEYVSSRTLSTTIGNSMGRKIPKKTLQRAKSLAAGRLTEWSYQYNRRGWTRCPF